MWWRLLKLLARQAGIGALSVKEMRFRSTNEAAGIER